jgi:hypothetical protein
VNKTVISPISQGRPSFYLGEFNVRKGWPDGPTAEELGSKEERQRMGKIWSKRSLFQKG